MRARPVEIELRLQSLEIPRCVAYHLENVAKRFLKFVEGRFEHDLIGDDDDIQLEAADRRLLRNET